MHPLRATVTVASDSEHVESLMVSPRRRTVLYVLYVLYM